MDTRFVRLICALFTLILCAPAAHAYEITDSVAKARLVKRLDARYYNPRDHRFLVADCDVRSSIMDDIDTMLSARGSRRNPALRAFRAMKTSLHFGFIVPITVDTKGSVRTDDKQLDSLISQMLGWSEKQLLRAIVAWRANTISWSDGTSESMYRFFREGNGYRIQGIAPGNGYTVDFLIDSALTITKMNVVAGDASGSFLPQFRETGQGLILSRLDVSLPRLNITYGCMIEHKEVRGVLLPSSIVVSVDNPVESLGGMPMGKMDITFTLSNYRIIKG